MSVGKHIFRAKLSDGNEAMANYRLTFDVYNSWRPEFPSQRVSLVAWGITPRDALKRVRTIFVSKNGQTVNTTGGVGRDGYYYPEWTLVRSRKVGA